MIDFKTHIKLFEDINSESDGSGYFDNLNPLERLEISREIEETYPIKNQSRVSDYLKEHFNVTTCVDDAVLGQFIMLEQIITGKTQFKKDYERDLTFAKLILRPKHHKVFDNEDPEEEQKNEENILNAPVQDVYDVVNYYLDNRELVLFKQFAGVFYEVKDDEQEDEEGEVIDRTAENLFRSQWYWYSIVRMLAKEDITKYDQIYMLKMSTVLPEMSFITQRDKIESANKRQQQAMNKL
jgi:hypothetical protein